MSNENLPSKIAQANAITMGRQPFSVIEKRCLYFIIAEVRRLYVDTNTGQKDLFDNMTLKIPSDKLKGLADEVKDVYKALKKMSNKSFEIENDEVWIYTRWILQAKHMKKLDIYVVDVSRDILPYLVQLASDFTTYDLTVALCLKSTYSQRLYEICNQFKNRTNKTFFLEVDKLRYILMLENKKSYDNVSEFKRSVLDVAQKELKDLYDNGQSDLYFNYRPKETKGKKIISFFFDIVTKKTEEQKKLDFQNTQSQIISILSICKEFIKNDSKYIKRVQNALQLRPDDAQKVLEKLHRIVNKHTKEDIPKLIRYMLSEDFDIS